MRHPPDPKHSKRPAHPAGHLADDRLLALARGVADAASRAEARAHAATCRDCRSLLVAAERVVLARRAGELESLPPGLHRRALVVFEEWRAAKRGLAGLAERALGRLKLLGRIETLALAPGAVPGVRSGGAAVAAARCELVGGGYRLELEWTPAGTAFALRGRVLGKPASGLSLEFEGERPQRVTLGRRGFFGPVRGASPRLRAMLDTPERSFRSDWLTHPAATRRGPSRARPPARKRPPRKSP